MAVTAESPAAITGSSSPGLWWRPPAVCGRGRHLGAATVGWGYVGRTGPPGGGEGGGGGGASETHLN